MLRCAVGAPHSNNGRWLKDSSIVNFDIRELLDWEYYIGR